MQFRIVACCYLIVVVMSDCVCASANNNKLIKKQCRVQEDLIDRELWVRRTCFTCYKYTIDHRLKFQYPSEEYWEEDTGFSYYITKLKNGTFFWYDYENETSRFYISKSFKAPEFVDMWMDCCRDAVECCDNFMTATNVVPSATLPCPAVWDGWFCFPPAKAGTVQVHDCPKEAYSNPTGVCLLKQTRKECFRNGTWNQTTDYHACPIKPIVRQRHQLHILTLSISTLLSLPSLFIFFGFRKCRKMLRLILHRNLIVAISVRNLLSIVAKETVILDALDPNGNLVIETNGVACRILAFFENAAKNSIYACILIDGFYLHKMIVRPFMQEPQLGALHAVVGVLTALPNVIWAVCRAVKDGQDCWMVDESNDQWILDGFRIAILVVNVLFLMDILRVLVLKLSKSKASTKSAKASLKATLFLMPVFGVHIVILLSRDLVPDNTCIAEDIYYTVSDVIDGLQSVTVAVCFCYLSNEVHVIIRKSLTKNLIKFEQRYGWHCWQLKQKSPGTTPTRNKK